MILNFFKSIAQILKNTEKLLKMADQNASAVADLQAQQALDSAAISGLSQLFTDGVTKLEALIASLQANGNSDVSAQIKAVVDGMKADKANIDAMANTITTEEAKEGV